MKENTFNQTGFMTLNHSMIFGWSQSIYTQVDGRWKSIINLTYHTTVTPERSVWSPYSEHEEEMCDRPRGSWVSWTFLLSQHGEASDHAHAQWPALHGLRVHKGGQTHSLSKGMDVLLLLFCTMLAWFLNEIRIIAGANLQGSPSTCMGMDL